jgi:hypothetical protein
MKELDLGLKFNSIKEARNVVDELAVLVKSKNDEIFKLETIMNEK